MADNADNKDHDIPEGFELVSEDEIVRRLGFRLVGDRKQIAEDEEFMRMMRGKGFGDWERG